MKRTKILYKSVTNHDLIGLIGLESEYNCISNSYSDMIRDAIKRELNKWGDDFSEQIMFVFVCDFNN